MDYRILIDADGCPVVNQAIVLAKEFKVECYILCDTSHYYQRAGATTLTFSKGADSVDFALVNLLKPNDIVITQDYGLAAMALARKARILNQNGMRYTDFNIESLLEVRYQTKKRRAAGERVKGSAKRTCAQDESFIKALRIMLMEEI
ncbi:MAG: DUF188 domain-containing protein [Faecalibacterium sp.]